MSVDTILYLNSRWELDDIKKVIERTQQTKVVVHSNHDISTGFFNFIFNDRRMSVFTNHSTPIGTATYLSLGWNSEAVKIMRDIATVFGGVLIEEDSSGNAEFINGNMNDDDKLAYHLKYAIVDNGIEPDDLQGFIDSMRKWYKEISSSHKTIEVH